MLPPFLLLEFSSPWQLGPLRPLLWSPHPRAPCQWTWAAGSRPNQPELPPPPAALAPSPGTSWISSPPPSPSQEVLGSLAALSLPPPIQRAAQGPHGTPSYQQLTLSFSGPSLLPPPLPPTVSLIKPSLHHPSSTPTAGPTYINNNNNNNSSIIPPLSLFPPDSTFGDPLPQPKADGHVHLGFYNIDGFLVTS